MNQFDILKDNSKVIFEGFDTINQIEEYLLKEYVRLPYFFNFFDSDTFLISRNFIVPKVIRKVKEIKILDENEYPILKNSWANIYALYDYDLGKYLKFLDKNYDENIVNDSIISIWDYFSFQQLISSHSIRIEQVDSFVNASNDFTYFDVFNGDSVKEYGIWKTHQVKCSNKIEIGYHWKTSKNPETYNCKLHSTIGNSFILANKKENNITSTFYFATLSKQFNRLIFNILGFNSNSIMHSITIDY